MCPCLLILRAKSGNWKKMRKESIVVYLNKNPVVHMKQLCKAENVCFCN